MIPVWLVSDKRSRLRDDDVVVVLSGTQADLYHTLGYGDIWLAFKRKYGDDDTDDFGFDDTQSLTVDQLFRLLCDCFTHLKFKEHRAVYNADHLRWRKLPSSVTHSLSVHGSKIGFPERLRKEAHELLYMKPKARVRNW